MPKTAILRAAGNQKPVFIDGVRSAFVKSFGVLEDCDTLELYSRVTDGLLKRLPMAAELIDELIAGAVVPQTKNANIARDTVINLGLPLHIPGYTLNGACLSGLQGVVNAMQTITYGRPHFILAGGVECLSDIPLVYSREARKFLVKLTKAKSAAAKLNIIKHFRAKAWFPKQLELVEPLTGLSMGEHAELMAQKNRISRAAQDAFALASQQKAAKARAAGYFADEIIPVWPPPEYTPFIAQDNNIRDNLSSEELAALKESFAKRYGTLTAGNSAPLADGAAVCLIADAKRAQDHGLQAKVRLLDYDVVAVDPYDQLLIGPALTIPRLLQRNGLQLGDIDRFEIHEAFAAQILSCLRAMDDAPFCERQLGLSKAVGALPPEKLNVNGGSLAIGHPFAATGVRLLSTLAQELRRSDKQLGVVALCAAGGMAASLLVERCS